MATKRKGKKKSTPKRASRGKVAPTKKRTQNKVRAPKKSSKPASTPNKARTKSKTTASAAKKGSRRTRERRDTLAFSGETLESRSGVQSGDLQGLSQNEGVDSESVDELVEEGNAFEAGVVSGVEDAGNRGVKEVRTREVPEDDVPEEYLDKE
jgi:hypothetical protein